MLKDNAQKRLKRIKAIPKPKAKGVRRSTICFTDISKFTI